MKLLIQGGRVLDPASGRDEHTDVVISAGRILRIGPADPAFEPDRRMDASGCWVLPGLVDLAARLGEPGGEHAGLLASEISAAVAGGITSLVCPPDTDPVLDEPSIVEMLKMRTQRQRGARVFPLGALTRGLQGEALAEMLQLTEAGCVAFGQAGRPIVNTRVLLRALQYATTFGYAVWLRPQHAWFEGGVAASGAMATRRGLSGVPVLSETIALHTIFELMRTMPAGAQGPRVHICRLSSAAGLHLLRAARDQGLNVSADVSIHSLLLTDQDLENFDSRARLDPPLRSPADREALAAALADGTVQALVSDHTPVTADTKQLPFADAQAGASALELLLPLAVAWGQGDGRGTAGLHRALQAVTSGPAGVLGAALGTFQASCGRLVEGGAADLCVFDPQARWTVRADQLRSQGKYTPFLGQELVGRVRATLVDGYWIDAT